MRAGIYRNWSGSVSSVLSDSHEQMHHSVYVYPWRYWLPQGCGMLSPTPVGWLGMAHRCVAFHLRGHVAAGEAVNDNASLVAVILGFMAFIGFLCWLFNSAWPVILVFLWLIL